MNDEHRERRQAGSITTAGVELARLEPGSIPIWVVCVHSVLSTSQPLLFYQSRSPVMKSESEASQTPAPAPTQSTATQYTAQWGTARTYTPASNLLIFIPNYCFDSDIPIDPALQQQSQVATSVFACFHFSEHADLRLVQRPLITSTRNIIPKRPTRTTNMPQR